MHPMTAYYQAEAHAGDLRREAERYRAAAPARRARAAVPLREAVGFKVLELGLRMVAR